MFVHFGLYSSMGKGEWIYSYLDEAGKKEYRNIAKSLRINKNWARELVRTAKRLGAKYITLTTRHHDGFSLYDTCGLSGFDAPHSACGRDLIAEFVEACNKSGITPFFYHTLLDWHNPDYKENFPKYIDYLVKSVEILCRNYGKIGGIWFDGMWDKPNEDWQEDRLYGTIRKYQTDAMIINNTGLSELGKVGHPEIDSVTFERGNPAHVDNSDRPRAGEMCQVLNDHWGYAAEDCNYKSVAELIENLVDCRASGCNFLLNTGLRGNGTVNPTDKCLLTEVGKWVHVNKDFVYGTEPAGIKAENAAVVMRGGKYYVAVKKVNMLADPNVVRGGANAHVRLPLSIKRGMWLDSGEEVKPTDKNEFDAQSFGYGRSYSVRVAEMECEKV